MKNKKNVKSRLDFVQAQEEIKKDEVKKQLSCLETKLRQGRSFSEMN